MEPQLSCVNSNRQKSFQTSCVRFGGWWIWKSVAIYILKSQFPTHVVILHVFVSIVSESSLLWCFWTAQRSAVNQTEIVNTFLSFVVLMMFWVSLNVTFSCVFLSMEAITAHDDVFYLHWRFFRWKYKLLFVLNVSFMFVLMYLFVVVSLPLQHLKQRKQQNFLHHRYFVLITL